MKDKAFWILASVLLAGVAGAAFASNGDTAQARVLGGPPDPVQFIYEVELTAINGERIIPRDMLTLEPGRYTLTARVPAQITEPAVGQRKRRWSEDVNFEITLDPGKDYRVRAKWHRNDFEKPYELLIEEIR